jgi:nitric oxide reductase activation protein
MKKDPNKPITSTPKLNKTFKQAFVENRKCDHRELSDTDELDSFEDTKKRVEMSKKDMEATLQASQNNARTKISKIKDKIETEARKAKVSSAVLNEAVQEYFGSDLHLSYSDINPDMRVAQQLNKIFKLLQANQKPKLSDTGDSLSIPAVIRRMARGYGDIHIKQSPKDSLSILVSIDASGSMSGREINIAKDMMSTLYKSIHGINNIELKGVVWSGSEYHTSVCEVRNLKETQRIVCQGVFGGGTPTPAGVEYSERKLEEMKGKKKLLIVITDGYPNSYSNSTLTPEQMVRKEINRANKKGIMTLGIGVGMGVSDSDPMNIMFGKKGYITTCDMKDTQQIVIKKFRDIIIRQMRR